jgi:hypothetical protein
MCSALEGLIEQHNAQAEERCSGDEVPLDDELIKLKPFDPLSAGYESEDPFADSSDREED